MKKIKSAREVKKYLEFMISIFDGTSGLTDKELYELGYHKGSYGGRTYIRSYNHKDNICLNTNKYQLTKTRLDKMLKFVDEAIKQGFYGQVRFSDTYDNGMWAYSRLDNENNRFPNEGVALYHSFSSDENYWQVILNVKTNQRTDRMMRNEMRKYLKENNI